MGREELFKLYDLAIQEYRFQVQFNWDRTKQHMILNTAIVTVAFGMMQVANRWDTLLLSAGTFLVGILSAIFAWQAVETGHRYYRGTVFKAALIAELLDLHRSPAGAHDRNNLHVATLAGTAKIREILDDPALYLSARPPKRESVTFGHLLIFGLFLVINLGGLIMAIVRFTNR